MAVFNIETITRAESLVLAGIRPTGPDSPIPLADPVFAIAILASGAPANAAIAREVAAESLRDEAWLAANYARFIDNFCVSYLPRIDRGWSTRK